MRVVKICQGIVGTIILLVLVACSGGETGTGGTNAPNGPIDPKDPIINETTISGPITEFGSVVVGGIHFDTAESLITLDGKTIEESDLSIGAVATVTGIVNVDGVTGSALLIEVENVVRGVVELNEIAEKSTLLVSGQTVVINNDTVFQSSIADITTFSQIPEGSFIEVNGYTTGNGIVYAQIVNVVSKSAVGEEIVVNGLISSLTANRFDVGLQTISFDPASTSFVNFTVDQLAENLFVKVTATQGIDITSPISATTIELVEKVIEETGAEIKLFGIVTSDGVVNNEFTLIDRTIVIEEGTTSFTQGDILQIILGAKVAVEGIVQEDGKVVADSIAVIGVSQIKLIGPVDAINLEAKTIEVFGLTIYIDAYTAFSKSSKHNRYFGLADIDIEDRLQIKVYADATSGKLIATSIYKEEDSKKDTDSFVIGFIAEVDIVSFILKVDGLNVIDGPNLDIDFSAVDPQPDTTLIGSVVQVTGDYNKKTGIFEATVITSDIPDLILPDDTYVHPGHGGGGNTQSKGSTSPITDGTTDAGTSDGMTMTGGTTGGTGGMSGGSGGQ